MKERRSLKALSKKLNSSSLEKIDEQKILSLKANPIHGERSDFAKLSISLPPDLHSVILQEVFRRKTAKEPNALISSIIREAVIFYFENKPKG